MALLGFQKWKADKVVRGECRQTIRARRAHPVKVGDWLILATGVRTKNYRRIADTVCTEAFPIQAASAPHGNGYMWLDITRKQLNDLAMRDGFESASDMTEWFAKNHPIKDGDVITFDVIRW